MKLHLLGLALFTTAVWLLVGCTADSKARFYHDGKTVIAIVKPVAKKLAEDELRILIEEALK